MSFLIGIVLGVGCLSFQAVLPDTLFCLLFLVVSIALLFLSFSNYFKKLHAIFAGAARLICGLCLGIAVGAFVLGRGSGDVLPEHLEERPIQVTGVVSALPHDTGRGANFEFSVEKAETDGMSVNIPSRIFLSAKDMPASIDVGQRWCFDVRLNRPHGVLNPYGFDFERWLYERNLGATGFVLTGIHQKTPVLLDDFVTTPMNLVNAMRSGIRNRILQAIPDSSASGIIVALVIGDQKAVSQHDWGLFSKTGISHLIAISGLHIALVAGLVGWFFGYFWRRSFYLKWQLPVILPAQKVSVLAGVIAALLYVLLSGMGIPARRVLIMIVIVAISMWSGRMQQIYLTLLLSAALILLIEPMAILKPGFWLSFIAVAFILYVSTGGSANSRHGRSFCSRLLSAVLAFCRIQIAITIGLSAVTLFFWGRVSIIGPLVNALAIPLFSFLVTPLALIGSLLPSEVSDFVLIIVSEILEWFCFVLEWVSGCLYADWALPVPSIWLVIFALMGACWMLAPKGWCGRLLGAGCFLPFLFLQASSPNDGEFKAVVFDVGQGSGVLVETSHHRLLFDTGPAIGDSNAADRNILPYLKARGIDQLDMVMVSHGDKDHSGGLGALLEKLPVESVVTSMESTAVPYPMRLCVSGQYWTWDGVLFEVIYPDKSDYFYKSKTNDLSCIIKVSNHKKSLLMTGDIERESEESLVKRHGNRLRSDILVAPHHGSATSSSWPFLLAVRPTYSIFQVGYRNAYHHPHPQTINRYALAGVKTFRSDFDGAVLIDSSSDGVPVEGLRAERARFWYAENIKK